MPRELVALLADAARCLREGRPADAIGPLRAAHAIRPGDAVICHDLGLACLETGRPAEAITAFETAAAAWPQDADTAFRLGVARELGGDPRGAVLAYDRATTLRPGLSEAWYRAGAIVFTFGHREEAIACFRRAAASGPRTGIGRLARARALLAEERDDEAERSLRHAVALAPRDAAAHDLLGNLLADQGRFDGARTSFAHAIEHAPLMAGSWYDLVRCRRLTQDDLGLVARMEQALATPGLDTEQRVRLHLALGKAADDLGDPARAMAAFDAAQALRSQLSPFDLAAFEAGVERLIARPVEPLSGRLDRTPVLIVGLPRSGTTLTEQILSSHPEIAGAGELNFWNERGGELLGLPFPPDGATLDVLAGDYLGVLRGVGGGASRVTDKMPFNLLWAGLVHRALPQATIIHCRRRAIDIALSIQQTHFNPRLAFPTGGAALVAYIRACRRLAAHWRRTLPPERFIEFDYETLVADPEPIIRRLVAATGLLWDPACLNPERNPRAVRTPSRWQARQAIHAGAVDRWRRYEPWLGTLRPLLEDGEDPDDGSH